MAPLRSVFLDICAVLLLNSSLVQTPICGDSVATTVVAPSGNQSLPWKSTPAWTSQANAVPRQPESRWFYERKNIIKVSVDSKANSNSTFRQSSMKHEFLDEDKDRPTCTIPSCSLQIEVDESSLQSLNTYTDSFPSPKMPNLNTTCCVQKCVEKREIDYRKRILNLSPVTYAAMQYFKILLEHALKISTNWTSAKRSVAFVEATNDLSEDCEVGIPWPRWAEHFCNYNSAGRTRTRLRRKLSKASKHVVRCDNQTRRKAGVIHFGWKAGKTGVHYIEMTCMQQTFLSRLATYWRSTKDLAAISEFMIYFMAFWILITSPLWRKARTGITRGIPLVSRRSAREHLLVTYKVMNGGMNVFERSKKSINITGSRESRTDDKFVEVDEKPEHSVVPDSSSDPRNSERILNVDVVTVRENGCIVVGRSKSKTIDETEESEEEPELSVAPDSSSGRENLQSFLDVDVPTIHENDEILVGCSNSKTEDKIEEIFEKAELSILRDCSSQQGSSNVNAQQIQETCETSALIATATIIPTAITTRVAATDQYPCSAKELTNTIHSDTHVLKSDSHIVFKKYKNWAIPDLYATHDEYIEIAVSAQQPAVLELTAVANSNGKELTSCRPMFIPKQSSRLHKVLQALVRRNKTGASCNPIKKFFRRKRDCKDDTSSLEMQELAFSTAQTGTLELGRRKNSSGSWPHSFWRF